MHPYTGKYSTHLGTIELRGTISNSSYRILLNRNPIDLILIPFQSHNPEYTAIKGKKIHLKTFWKIEKNSW